MNWYSANNISNILFSNDDELILNANLNVVLIAPEIAPNAGNISRLCYASNTKLHIIGKMGFDIKSDKHFKRAAIDYWDKIKISYYNDFDEFLNFVYKSVENKRQDIPQIILTSTNGKKLYFEFNFKPGDYIVFGPESTGIEPKLLKQFEENTIRIPLSSNVRSLNLSTACGIILYHAIYFIYSSSKK